MAGSGSKRKVLITGISGQDGSYLAELLLQKGCEVYGTTRDPGTHLGLNLVHLAGKVRLLYTNYELISIVDLLQRVRPDEIYNYAGQTYVGKSWEMLDDTFKASAQLPANILEAIVRVDKNIKFFQASSCELYSLNWQTKITEDTPITPSNPYGCSKAFAHHMVAGYRNRYGIYAVNGIYFHHESPRRHENFVSQKVVKAAVAIKLGRQNELALGNLDVARDWSFAPDFVTATERMMALNQPQDLVLCSGKTHQLQELMTGVFDLLDLDHRKYVRVDQAFVRAAEAPIISGSNDRACKVLNWKPKTSFAGMLEKMVSYELKMQQGEEKDFRNERPFQ